jgi:superfamily I DNA/RNA helicase
VSLFPQGKTRILERADAGEKRVLNALARQLEDDYTVWHNIPIMGSGREPDFVILHPQRGLLFPELRLGDQQPLPLEPSLSALVVRDVLQVMDQQQEAVARGLGEGHRLIHGPAGSGKTMILIFRALQLQQAARPDKPILVLCYNRALRDRIEAMLRLRGVGPAVQVRTFHSWALELVRTYQLAPVKASLTSEDFDAIAALACDGIASARVPPGQYTALLIDEAHDLADDWLAAAVRMVDPATKSLLVLYDDAQSIYQKSRRKLSFAKLGVEARGRTEILKINYRNTREVLSLALECARPILLEKQSADGDDVPLVLPDSAGRTGPLPVLRRFAKPPHEYRFVAERIAELRAAGRSLNDIVIAARVAYPLRVLQEVLQKHGIRAVHLKEAGRAPAGDEFVRLTTLHSSKGLEFPVVFLIGLNLLDAREAALADELRLLYVGMTRATQELYLSASADSPIVEQVEASLVRLQPAAVA